MKVFISHSTKDREFVDGDLIPFLRSHQIGTWYSKDDIKVAEEWEKAIRASLQASDWVLVVLSPDATSSAWVKAEVAWAFENKAGRILPVLNHACDPSELHLKLIGIQYVDYHADVIAARERILATLAPGQTIADAQSPSAPMPARVPELEVVVQEPGKRTRTLLLDPTKARRFLIGSDFGCHVHIDAMLCSRHHACLVAKTDGNWWIKDLDSLNGTSLNGVPVRSATDKRIGPGDTVELSGSVRLQIRLPTARPRADGGLVSYLIRRLSNQIRHLRGG